MEEVFDRIYWYSKEAMELVLHREEACSFLILTMNILDSWELRKARGTEHY